MTILKPAATFPTKQLDWRGWLFAFAALIVAVDRLTKVWVSRHVATDDAITVIPRVFRITHVLNPGAAFSLFNDSPSPGRIRVMLIAFSVIAAVAVFVALIKMGRRITPTTMALACILAGALGNVYDRVKFGTVIDFLEVHIFSYHWPDFNVADSAIVIGGILLLLDAFRSQAPEASAPAALGPQGSSADELD
ncbi:MAG TPA: signal peptidase II, partial [Acidisarcina sp.]